MRRLAVAALVAVLGSGLSGCGGSSTDDYCAAVTAHRDDLSKVLADGGPAALLDALPILRELQAKAPGDIAGDWATVTGRLAALQQALAAAGVDAHHYDSSHPPASLTPAQRQRIADAATALGSAATAQALDAVQQQARDVCHTPLTL